MGGRSAGRQAGMHLEDNFGWLAYYITFIACVYLSELACSGVNVNCTLDTDHII